MWRLLARMVWKIEALSGEVALGRDESRAQLLDLAHAPAFIEKRSEWAV